MKKTINEYYKYIRETIKIDHVCRKLDVNLQAVGDDYLCHCFFHSDEHPSMRLYMETNRYHCFQCGKSGDVFELIKEKLGCDFNHSLSWIENEFPELLSEKPLPGSGEDKYFSNQYELAWSFYKEMDTQEKTQLGKFAAKREYDINFLLNAEVVFAKKRKLLRALGGMEDSIGEKSSLEDVGLLAKIPKRQHDIQLGRYEDFFKSDRIIIALRDNTGKAIGFAGRSVSESDKPKYLFTKNLKKREWLYRFHIVKQRKDQWKQNQIEELYLVEGIFDALRLEENGKSAVAVMGSHLLQGQAQAVAEYVEQAKHIVKICVFMDNDTAGLEGNYNTIKNLWKYNVLRHTNICVKVIEKEKDPDAYYIKSKNNAGREPDTYSSIEYLFRYALCGEYNKLTQLNPVKDYEEKTTEEKIQILHMIENLMTREEWQELFAWHQTTDDKSGGRLGQKENSEQFCWNLLQNYVRGVGGTNEYTGDGQKDYLFHMQTALQIARTSYQRESLLLDEQSWDRIAVCADAYFPYFYQLLKEQKSFVDFPMIEILLPKKKDEQRKKSYYIHEETVVQQYVLNELLSRGMNAQYENFVPAVRYEDGRGVYLTGYGYQDLMEEVVSFAYQVQMSSVTGTSEIAKGMFRPFYDCWRDYIEYVQDGIQRLEGDIVYRVKLDIKGYYDNIRKYTVRDAIFEPIRQALLKDNSKFSCFRDKDQEENDECAQKLVDWILGELYKEKCYRADNGQLYRKENKNCGIPQGPNLSAYIANVLLFQVDKQIYHIVQEANENCTEGHIAARYCRYVDDMIIIASKPAVLLKIKDAVAAKLYDLGLELSNKTDTEDGVSKAEAVEWTVDARGGLGVSVAFDMADDTIESIWDQCDEYEVVDRRNALKILQSNLKPLLFEGVPTNIDVQQFLDTVFRIDGIRINDIIRFGEFLIYQAAEESEDLFEQFLKLWKRGMKNCPEESVLWTEGMEVFVFMECCIKILQRLKSKDKAEVYNLWRKAGEKIRVSFYEKHTILAILEGKDTEKELLRKNAWILRLKLLQIYSLIGESGDLPSKVEKNEYWERWLWTVDSGETICSKRPEILQIFQYVAEKYRKAKTEQDIEEVNSQIGNYLGKYFQLGGQDILLDCMLIWLQKTNKNEYPEEVKLAALRVIFNLLKPVLKAEIIGRNPIFTSILFGKLMEGTILPVFPGVDYPGIMGYISENGKTVVTAERYDFVGVDKLTPSDEKWSELSERTGIIEQAKCYSAKWEHLKMQYISLEEYLGDEKELPKIMTKVVQVYQKLAEAIQQVYQEYSDKRIMLSKRNVILCIDKASEVQSIELGISYLVPAEKANDTVAIERDSSYILQSINASGAAFWIAGYLLADACHLEQINLEQCTKDGDYIDNADMLRYSFKRLCGHYLHKSAIGNRSEHSYRKAMDRAVENIKGFLANAKFKKIYLENARIENSFIKFRLEQKSFQFQENCLQLAIWAKNYIRYGYQALAENINATEGIQPTQYGFLRRVPRWYCYLADRLWQLGNMNDQTFIATRVLSAGFFADAVLMNLRMQVLERIRYLSKEERELFLKQDPVTALVELGLDESTVLMLQGHENERWVELWNNLLNLKNDRNIRFVTHFGWIVMLAGLYEIGKTESFILQSNKSRWEKEEESHDYGNAVEVEPDSDSVVNVAELLKVVINLISSAMSEKTDKETFPFEGMEVFYKGWVPETVHQMIEVFNTLDKISDIEVVRCQYAEYRQAVQKSQVIIDYDNGQLKENLYFLTFSKVDDSNAQLERDIVNREEIIFTITKKGKKILGVSTIISKFGDLLQEWEKPMNNDQMEVKEQVEEGQEKLDNEEIQDEKKRIEDKTLREKITGEKEQKDEKQEMKERKSMGGGVEQEEKGEEEVALYEKDQGMEYGKEDESSKEAVIKITSGIQGLQGKLWGKRVKEFDNYDRIALFQFQIDNSYYPPSTEICENLPETTNNNKSDKWKSSCAEFRRRKLLEPVLEACETFGVEILLLPEYSVRPETVEWMAKKIEDNGYKFSVWAGTFRIPVEHQFPEKYWYDPQSLGERVCYHAAPLPIIVRDEESGKSVILTHKMKKYPSIALHEEINPVKVVKDNFKPVMKKYYDDRYAKGMLLGDARDDVTEVICAEMFVLSAICNYPSFLKEYASAYNRYAPLKSCETELEYEKQGLEREKKKYEKQMLEHEKQMLEDIKQYGKYIAIYQREKWYYRTPIVLIPVCSTRVSDYYIWGQGNYLAAGIKTVLCNSVGGGMNGGSCFIGQDSWDDKKVIHDEKIISNTIYHGLKPGMYMQSYEDSDRGALGDKEQALLIYDVNPNYEKTNPNAESMLDALSIVAHIPIFEMGINADICKDCKNKYICKGNRSLERKEVETRLEKLIRYCSDMQVENTIQVQPDLEKNGGSSGEIVKCMMELGQDYHSDWLKLRGRYYKEYSCARPQKWIAPTLLDWLYIVVDYQDFVNLQTDEEGKCFIQVNE